MDILPKSILTKEERAMAVTGRIGIGILVVLLWWSEGRGQEDAFEVRAISGEPFGVAELIRKESGSGSKSRFQIESLGSGALYPVATRTGCRFLFAPSSKHVRVGNDLVNLKADASGERWQQELDLWWQAYVDHARLAQRGDHMPLQVNQYLVTMLSRRLKLPAVDLSSTTYFGDSSESRFFALLTGSESIRVALQKETLLQTSDSIQPADCPVPEPVLPPAVQIPEPAPNVEVEPLAMQIPPEFFYVRLAGYQDLTWAQKQLDELGTDVRDFLNARAFDYHLSARIQDQLELHDSELAQLLGPHVIDDLAVIGTDTFLREGAGIGVVFHARVSEVLRNNLNAQRLSRQQSEPGSTLEQVTFDGHSGTHSLLSMPDNRLRSFYVQSGDYHLVTTSRHLAQRFLEVAESPELSLGALEEFRYARTVMPLSRQDNVFIHLSDPFFRSFIHPRTRIEMTRRAKSDNDMELLQMAALAAQGEGNPAKTIDELIAAGFLPSKFGTRADGSRLSWEGHQVTDTVRGGRGTFLPVVDVEFDQVTADEIEAYKSFSDMYLRIWQRMDPASVGIRRVDEGGQERLLVDLHVCPFPVNDYSWLGFFQSEKDGKAVAPVEGLVVLVEGDVLKMSPVIAGFADFEPCIRILESMKTAGDYYETPPAFVGEPRKDGKEVSLFGDRLPADLPEDTVHELNRSGFSNCGMRSGPFELWAAERQALEAVAGKLREVDAPRPAKARVHIYDISNAKASKLAHVLGWLQARKIADGNASLLNQFVSQFRVAPDQVSVVVDRVFDASLVHPLNGRWVVNPGQSVTDEGGMERMTYRQPLLNRLRGAEIELNSEGNVLTTHLEILLDKPEKQ
ncbi:MAG: hypothetical protein ACK58L_06460 [Planctomycetota bacterium]